MLQTLLTKQQNSLNFFFQKLDNAQAKKILDVMSGCLGSLIFSGVGKSGMIAEKIAATFSSIGVRSFYVSPTDLVHGELGRVSSEDVFICLSKSGETKELLLLIPYLKQKFIKILAWVSQDGSSLQRLADLSILLPVDMELCPFNLAPTISSEVQLIFGDLLTVAFMHKKELSLEEYAKNHPAGSIGKIANYSVADVMLKDEDLPICHPHDKLKDVLVELSNKRCGCLVVVDEDKKVQGIFTDGDLRRALQSQPAFILEEMMKDLMTEKVLVVEEKKSLYEAAKVMKRNATQWVSALPVVQGNCLVGLVRLHDVIGANL